MVRREPLGVVQAQKLLRSCRDRRVGRISLAVGQAPIATCTFTPASFVVVPGIGEPGAVGTTRVFL